MDVERQARIDGVGFEYHATPKRRIEKCDLCGNSVFTVISHHDRYGFEAQADACNRCGLVFLNPVMTVDAYRDFYRHTYRPLVSAFHGRLIDHTTVQELEQVPYAEELVTFIGPVLESRPADDLLDVGGSTGVIAARVAEEFDLVATVLDPSPDELGEAKKRGLNTIEGFAEEADIENDSFDVVLLCQTIDHLLEISQTLAKIRQCIRPGGLFFVDIVDFRAAYLRNRSVELAIKVDHPYYLTETSIESYLARAGFDVIRKNFAPDHLHVGYICTPSLPVPEVPSREAVERSQREIRHVQNSPDE